MKKIKLILGATGMLVLFMISCKRDFLDTTPKDQVSSDVTWGDAALSQAFIYGIYAYLGYGGFEEQALAAYTDEAMFTHAGRNINTFTQGTESPSNIAWTSDTYGWDKMYQAIRAANTAIERLPAATFDASSRDRLLGEAYFLRGYYYQQLLRFYGGVPLIDKTYGLDEDYTIARNTYDECVQFIVSDLDKAAQLLDGKDETPGRASKLAAQALKSRVLLYAASDLHDGPTAKAKSSTLAGYSNLDLLAYPSGDRTARWNAAKAAAKVVLDATSGYKLDLSTPVSATDGTLNYMSIAMGGKSGAPGLDASASKELIFQRTSTTLYTQEDNWPLGGIHYGINNGPNGYHNWAGNTPIQLLVDDYEMMDGSKFDWNKPAQAAHPYVDRDPRFYATILYDGAKWKPRPADVTSKDPADQIQTGYYDNGSGGFLNGIDTRESEIENWNGSRTHYYTRKFIDPNPALPDNQSNGQIIPWPFIRYTEVALNYIEACLETGDETEAKKWLDKIRFRAGMPSISALSGDALRDEYRNERRIELVYEEHRYHDARRWMIPAQTVGRGIKAIKVTAKLKPGKSALVPYRHDETVYDYTYQVTDNTENETRIWDDKMYYRAINRDEINKNNKLVNNPGF